MTFAKPVAVMSQIRQATWLISLNLCSAFSHFSKISFNCFLILSDIFCKRKSQMKRNSKGNRIPVCFISFHKTGHSSRACNFKDFSLFSS